MNWSIRSVLFAALTIVVVVVTGSLVVPTLLQQQRVADQLAANMATSVHRQVDTALHQLIDPVDRRLRTDLEQVRRGHLPRHDARLLREQLLPPMRDLRGVDSMMVGDETGYQLLMMRWSQAAADSPLLAGVAGVPPVTDDAVQFFTREFRRAEWGDRSLWTLWEETGQHAAAEWTVHLPDYDPRTRPWQTAALARLRELEAAGSPRDASPVVWTEVYSLYTTKRPGISASAAARCPDGSVTIIAYDLLLDDLCEFTRGQLPTRNARVFLCTDDGLALALPGTPGPDRRDARLLQPIAAGGGPLVGWHEHWRDRGDHRARTFTFAVQDEDWWGAWQAFELGKAPIWLGIAVPRQDLLALVGYAPGSHLALALPAFLAALALATWLSWRLASPLRAVANLSERIGRLDLGEGRTPRSRIAELRLLIDSLVAMRASLRDHVGAREHSARQLATSEERYRTTFELAAVGIAHVGPDNRFLMVNDQFCQMLGRSREELLRQRAIDVTWPEDRTGDWDRWTRFLADPAADLRTAWEKRWQHHDGRLVPTQAALRRLEREPGQTSHCVLVVQDISARLELESRLHQARRLEAVGRLAGGIAHDFNNLLTGLLGHLAMAAEQMAPQDQARAEIRAAENLALGATTLIRQLLTFARRDLPDRRVVDVVATVHATKDLLQRLLPEHIRLSIDAADGPLPVRIDPMHLQQVVVNLAVNAQDAMPDGGPLTIRVVRGPTTEPPSVQLQVADAGLGMTEEARKHAFEPFFTTKPPGQGTGLGLATCYTIVEQAHGTITLDSAPGTGTVVTIRLPLAADAGSDLATGEPPAPAGATATANLRGHETILCVEDEPSIRAIVERTLAAHGYRVLATGSGEEALAAARELPHFDLLLTDVVMSGMHGGDLARTLRASHPHLRVLFMSGYAADRLDDQMLADSSLLQKPYTPRELLARVREVLDRAPPAAGPQVTSR